MSIASEITRINTNIANAYTSLNAKGATMPTQDNQNSANLADTIDSVPSGGGGGTEFSDVASLVSDAVTWLEGKTIEQAYTNGWLVPENQQSSSDSIFSSVTNVVTGVVFQNDIPDVVYVRALAIQAPTGTTVNNTGLTNSIMKVTFPNNVDKKWLVLAGECYIELNDGMHQIAFVPDVTNGSNCNVIQDSYRYINISMRSNTYTSSYFYTTSYPASKPRWVGSRFLEELYISDNLKFSISSLLSSTTASDLNKLAFQSDKVSIKDFFDKNISDATYQTTVLSQTLSSGIVTSSTQLKYWFAREDFPFILDCSGMPSSTSTWYLGSTSYTSSSSMDRGFTKVKIKLPDMKIQVYNSNNDRFVPLEYIKYMADNAPTVSSRTFKLGSILKSIVDAQEPSIVTTLQNKGWTVS